MCYLCYKADFQAALAAIGKTPGLQQGTSSAKAGVYKIGHYKNGMSPQFHFDMKFITACQEILLLYDSKHGCGTDFFSSLYLTRRNSS